MNKPDHDYGEKQEREHGTAYSRPLESGAKKCRGHDSEQGGDGEWQKDHVSTANN